LHLRYTAGGHSIVGTTPEYFDFRNLEIAEGRLMAILGECVLGARAADALASGLGDFVLSTPAGAFDVAGSFPLKMKVVGMLQPVNTPDDEAVFVAPKTAWVIQRRSSKLSRARIHSAPSAEPHKFWGPWKT
jgi:putative ABC transport system permease protein